MEMTRRAQGCWTCKKRKIGCDRGYPCCNNCARTGRECEGYGIRLHWPDQPDGRRRLNRLPAHTVSSPITASAQYGKQFLNVTFADLEIAKAGLLSEALAVAQTQPRPARELHPLPSIQERESILMEYYHDKLSSMISTINVNNGFREEILPMALAHMGKASEGLRNAIFALSAYHLWGGKEALPYKAKAIRSLGSSIAETSGIHQTQLVLATSMMLCVYNVFDEAEGHWSLHLKGAQDILYVLAKLSGGRVRPTFLYTWFLYHEVLGDFVDPQHPGDGRPISLKLLQGVEYDKSLIIGSLGCSVEVMEIIGYVNGLRAAKLRGENTAVSSEEWQQRSREGREVEQKVAKLNQRLDSRDEEYLEPGAKAKILNTAELYRVATLLYLHRTQGQPQSLHIRSAYLDQAFQVLDRLKVCTSPWPLFVIACETDDDERRIHILQTLDAMDRERHIGNIFVLRSIIESFWKHVDLQADSGRTTDLQWWDVIDLKTTSPWFI